MSIVQNTFQSQGSSAFISLQFSSSVTVNHSVIVLIASAFPITSVVDNKGNSYALDAAGSAQGAYARVFRAFAVTGGASFVVTVTQQNAGHLHVEIVELDGLYQGAFNSAAGGVGVYDHEDGVGVAVTPGSIDTLGTPMFGAAAIELMAGIGGAVDSEGGGGPARFHSTLGSDWLELFTENLNSHASGLGIRIFTGGSGPLGTTWHVHKADVWAACVVDYYQRLDASFTGSPTSGLAPVDVTFTDASLGSPTSWSWDFGDGQVSTSQNPTHTYDQAGTYSVRLRISRQAVPDSTFERTNYIVISGAGSGGGGGLPTPPGIPTFSPGVSNSLPFPFPPIPGAPWTYVAFSRPHTDPPAPTVGAAPSSPPVLIPTAPGGDSDRVERQGRLVSLVRNALETAKLSPRAGENSFYILGQGFASESAPAATNDESQGVYVGATWVQVDSSDNVSLWICFDATIDAAVWRQADDVGTLGIGGISGTFP